MQNRIMARAIRRSSGRPKRVLLAWEYGAGRTHYGNLLSVAAHLRASGIECLAALCDTSSDREFIALGIHTIQNFVWPSQRRGHPTWKATESRGFTDHLARVGLNSGTAVTAAIAHYDGVFSLFQPDLVVCDQAYGAILAARDFIPVIAMAASSQLPPVIAGGFPLYPGYTEPVWPVERLLESINEGLTLAGRFPLSNIGQFLELDGVMPFGPGAFDLYAAHRTTPVLSPNVPGILDVLPDTVGDEVFIYLHGLIQNYSEVVDALTTLSLPTRAYIPNLTRPTAERLPANVVIEDYPVKLREILSRSRCVLHHGGLQLTAACLAAGLPQVILSKELDNRISGAFVESNGLGATSWIGDVKADWLDEALTAAYQQLGESCRSRAEEFQKWFSDDSSAVVASAACKLMGVAMRQRATTREPA